jgi:hypothetical protein
MGQTLLINNDNTDADLINCTGSLVWGRGPRFENFQVIATGVKNAGAGLNLNFNSVVNFVEILQVMSYNTPVCFRLKNAELGGMTGCIAIGYSDCGVYFENTQPLGEGDFSIQGCTFNTGIATGQPMGIRQISGAGLRIVNNKVLGGYGGFMVQQAAANAGGPLIIVGNSVEGITNYGIGLFSNASANPFDYVTITGNEITQQGTIGAAIAIDNTGKFIRMVISGNNIMFGSGSSSGISIANSNEFTISGNTIGCFTTSTSFGIEIASACSNGVITTNRIFSNNTISNSSTTVYGDTGTGSNVLAIGPTLVTPALGTPSSATLTNATGLPIASGVSGLGTGVATALAVNVGTAGSPVVNGGVLGTPSSGTVTNLTGSGNFTATGGASGAIAATTLSASSTVSGTGFSTYLASPPAIGGTAAAAVSSTALSYSTTLTGGTGIVNLGSGQFYKDASGNVGIGVTPSYKLDIAGSLNTNSGVSFKRYTNTSAPGNGLLLGTTAKATASSGGEGIFTITSNDAANKFEGTIALITDPTAGNRRLAISAIEQGVAFRDVTLVESGGNVGIGTANANASAILDVQSTTKGVRMPNMTTTQKNGISSPAAGLMVFDTTLAKLCVYSGSAWQTVTSV